MILNEQIETGNGTDDAAIETNAIHLIFTNLRVAGIGVLSGDIIVSHSQAAINDSFAIVPEPATWVQMIAGFGLVGGIVRRRRGTNVAAI